jgi:hypothetical protein
MAPDSLFHFDTITAGVAPLRQQTIPESTLQRLHRDNAFWYANAAFEKKAPAKRNLSFLQRLVMQEWFRNLLWAIIVCSFVVVLILFLMKSNITLFHKKPTVIQTAGESFFRENIFTINYESEISNAIQVGDFRLAVRLYYLQTLALLAGKNLIEYNDGFTNSDYVMQLRQSSYYGAFKKLTRHFEYTWYGHFPVTPDAFLNMEADFSTFKNSMEV